jgi:hypothetical protein
MIELVRSFFGLKGLSGKRTVVGNPVSVDLKEVRYIRDSNNRLSLLHTLWNRYKGTPHEPKIKTVYEKTNNIHNYLVARKKLTELELFHLQNTDHFINTFALIIDVHQKNKAEAIVPAGAEVEAQAGDNLYGAGNAPVYSNRPANPRPEKVKVTNYPGPETQVAFKAEAPQLNVPDIFLDTYARITYIRLDSTGELVSEEIGITSPAPEKEAFVSAMAARIGLYKPDVSYIGNALVQIPNGKGAAGYAPVINWKGYMYALDLNDYRLYPVKIYRKHADR